MITRSGLILTASCFCLLSSNFAFANPNQTDFGRLADGRAYRIDNEGYRITDQLAELEVANDDLRKQIIALENELDEKNKSLARVNRDGASLKPAVKEVSLVKQASAPQNNFQLQALEQRVGALSNELLQIKSDRDNCLQLAKTTTESKDNSELRMAQAHLSELTEALTQEQNRNQSLRTQLETIALQANKTVEVKRTESVPQVREQQLAKLERPAQTPTGRARIGESADRNLINSSLNDIQQLILKRKTLFDQAKQRRESVGVGLAVLRTNSGKSLDALRTLSKSAENDLQMQQASMGLKEIQQILNEDIELLTRLAKGRS